MAKESTGEEKPKKKRPSRAKPGAAPRGKTAEQMKVLTAKAAERAAKRGLNPQQVAWVHAYVQTWDATKASKIAGYSATSAHNIGHQMLKNPKIQAALQEVREAIKNDFRKTHEALAGYYLGILTVDAVEVMSQIEEAVQRGEAIPIEVGKYIESVKVKEVVAGMERDEESGKMRPVMGKQIEFKLFPKASAAEMLNKHVGFYEADNKQQPTSGVAIYLPDNGRGDAEGSDVAGG